jgi:hypothetical protein
MASEASTAKRARTTISDVALSTLPKEDETSFLVFENYENVEMKLEFENLKCSYQSSFRQSQMMALTKTVNVSSRSRISLRNKYTSVDSLIHFFSSSIFSAIIPLLFFSFFLHVTQHPPFTSNQPASKNAQGP